MRGRTGQIGMTTYLTALEGKLASWLALQPLGAEREGRRWKRLRLEWNYHSNRIEGNTLTHGETVLLLLHGRAAGDHVLRDYKEMQAHDAGIFHLREVASAARPLTEADVRDLNRIILKEPYWKPALTAEGMPSRKQIIPGECKTSPNNVLTVSGEIFEFAPPSDTPASMAALVSGLRTELESTTRHPVETAAWLHHQFVLIDPFDDGNGRVARMLMNYVLLLRGYPPIVVPAGDKEAYLTVLQKADTGNLPAFTAYLAEKWETALDLVIRAGQGEAVDEAGANLPPE